MPTWSSINLQESYLKWIYTTFYRPGACVVWPSMVQSLFAHLVRQYIPTLEMEPFYQESAPEKKWSVLKWLVSWFLFVQGGRALSMYCIFSKWIGRMFYRWKKHFEKAVQKNSQRIKLKFFFSFLPQIAKHHGKLWVLFLCHKLSLF